MTPNNAIPEAISRFIDGHVESMEQLEILRILNVSPGNQLSAADLATAAQIRPGDLPAQLAYLETRGLVTKEHRDGLDVCRLEPANAALAAEVAALLRFYEQRPVTLIRAIYQRTADRIKAFADSFRIRKDT